MKKIIVIEDDEAIQQVIKHMLQHEGCTVLTFPEGDLLLHGNYDLPDLFILDKQLPGIDGLELCRHLRNQDSTKDIPVIMLSASPDIGRMITTFGANDFLEKPFKMKDLKDMVAKHLG